MIGTHSSPHVATQHEPMGMTHTASPPPAIRTDKFEKIIHDAYHIMHEVTDQQRGRVSRAARSYVAIHNVGSLTRRWILICVDVCSLRLSHSTAKLGRMCRAIQDRLYMSCIASKETGDGRTDILAVRCAEGWWPCLALPGRISDTNVKFPNSDTMPKTGST